MSEFEGTKIIPVDISTEMKKSFLDYSMSVIVSRALPDVRDGLKPVHRRILYTLHENGLTPDKAYRKCADTVGSVLGRYHPHGDASVYDAMVRMAQSFSLRYPLIDGHGNFGSVDGDPPAAYRYTESRMSKISVEMLTDIEKDTINYISNYDDRLKEPQVLPSRLPNLLVNGSTGIAVGMATNIPPHNLNEVIDAVNLIIDDPEADINDIMEIIEGPDFPTAGIIMGRAGIRAAYATGRGKITLRCRAEVEEIRPNKMAIVVTELPYMVNKARLLENIANLVKDKRIDGISDLRDESNRKGMRMVIELKRDANAQIVLNQLYRFTQMQDTVGVILLALVDGVPKIMSLKTMIEEYIKFQVTVIRRRTEYELKKAMDRSHILEGLKIALDNIDEVIKIIRASKSIPESKDSLINRFNLSEAQSSAIVAMRLGQLTGLESDRIEEELANLVNKINELNEILANKQMILDILKKEILEIKRRFGDKRRTEIQSVTGEVDIEDLIPEEECVVTLTHYGYIKRQLSDVYKTQKRGGRGVSGMKQREEDFVTEMFLSSTHDNVLFITNTGRMFKLKCYEIPEGSKVARGINIVNLLPLEPDEKITCMLAVKDFTDDKFITMVTKLGNIKRTLLTKYKNVRKNGLIAIALKENDEIAAVKLTTGEDDLFIVTKKGAAIRFKENTVRPLSRQSMGVRGIKLREEDIVVSMEMLEDNTDKTLVTITNKGLGRRCLPSDFRTQTRGGYGLINYKTNDIKGQVVGVKLVDTSEDLIMIANDGIIIRIKVSDINTMSRYATGVKVMRLYNDVELVTFAKAEHDENSQTQEVEEIIEIIDESEINAIQALENEVNDIPEDENVIDLDDKIIDEN